MRIIILAMLLCGCDQTLISSYPTAQRCDELMQKWGKACMINRSEIEQCCDLYPKYNNHKRCLTGCF